MGTELMARGLRLGEPPERWVLEHPAAVAHVHARYVDAGSEAVHTCTFGANTVRLRAVGLEGRADEVVREAVRLARAARPRWVLGDMGPTGLRLPPGEGAEDRAPGPWRARLFEAHHGLARRLLDEGVDALHVETMTDAREALVALEAALRACAATGRDAPVWVSLTFRRASGPSPFVTLAGEPADVTLQALRRAGAHAVGANCLLQAPDMLALARHVAARGLGPVVLQPAAGQPREVSSPPPPQAGAEPHTAQEAPRRFVYDGDPEVFARALASAVQGDRARGGGGPLARAVGGCCGTTPAWIARLTTRLGGTRGG